MPPECVWDTRVLFAIAANIVGALVNIVMAAGARRAQRQADEERAVWRAHITQCDTLLVELEQELAARIGERPAARH